MKTHVDFGEEKCQHTTVETLQSGQEEHLKLQKEVENPYFRGYISTSLWEGLKNDITTFLYFFFDGLKSDFSFKVRISIEGGR